MFRLSRIILTLMTLAVTLVALHNEDISWIKVPFVLAAVTYVVSLPRKYPMITRRLCREIR